jgi:dihydroneopterin aldolase / 2-amino-4-hydroxy-6-hydroxymethyldihydropteridine diphosphokinase
VDKIKIKDLEIYCHHGVNKEETILGQKFLVSAVLYTNIEKAGKLDDIRYSTSYAEVSHFIKEFMKKNTYQLIEAVAENMSSGILKTFPLIEKIVLEVKKPWAPILLPLDTVSVEVKRGWHSVYVGIGSNLGNKEENLNQAISLLNEDEDCRVVKISDFLITKPVGPIEQEDFLNGALKVKTLRTPEELLDLVGEIENKLKRKRTVHWGPRTIDLDILLYDDWIVQTDRLIIPHCEMQNRKFVLEPLSNIAPTVKHPILDKTIYYLNQEFDKDNM